MVALRYRDEHNKVGYLQKPTGSDDYHQILDFLGSSHIRSPKLGSSAILATIDETPYTITEDSVRSQLQLADDGCNAPTQKGRSITNMCEKKLSLMGDLCPNAPSAIFTTIDRAPCGCHSATKIGHLPRDLRNTCFCGAQGILRETCPKLSIKDGGWVEMQRISAKIEEENKSGRENRKRGETLPIVRDFMKAFPEDLPGNYQNSLRELSDKGFIRPSSSPWTAPVQSYLSKERWAVQVVASTTDEKEQEENILRKFELLRRRRFIEGFSKRFAKSMTQLNQKGIKFDRARCQRRERFLVNKQKRAVHQFLLYLRGGEGLLVYCDALHKVLGVCTNAEERR
ncbi:hypothetical protein Tco_0939782 [Tanacetum coccineum]|uniref:Reverse transcriptase n=1 Tax=Tanacetum coccineum TaxID=301880 RepID=A0ABQ5DNG0_9ASTR